MVHYLNGKPVAADYNGGSKVIHAHRNCTEWYELSSRIPNIIKCWIVIFMPYCIGVHVTQLYCYVELDQNW